MIRKYEKRAKKDPRFQKKSDELSSTVETFEKSLEETPEVEVPEVEVPVEETPPVIGAVNNYSLIIVLFILLIILGAGYAYCKYHA